MVIFRKRAVLLSVSSSYLNIKCLSIFEGEQIAGTTWTQRPKDMVTFLHEIYADEQFLYRSNRTRRYSGPLISGKFGFLFQLTTPALNRMEMPFKLIVTDRARFKPFSRLFFYIFAWHDQFLVFGRIVQIIALFLKTRKVN